MDSDKPIMPNADNLSSPSKTGKKKTSPRGRWEKRESPKSSA